MSDAAHVARPPGRPLMIYDGECNFCKFWIIRWQHDVEGRIDFLPFQDARVGELFPELSREHLERAVHLVETDGTVTRGAKAVFSSLRHGGRFGGIPLWCYERAPLFAPITGWSYALVAANRQLFSWLTRQLWGTDGALPRYDRTRNLFLRMLGAIYLLAIVSLWTQASGLIGSHGLVPAQPFMEAVKTHFDGNDVGVSRYLQAPTIFWFGSSDGFITAVFVVGTILSLLLIAGLFSMPCLILLWLIYLSLMTVGRDFLAFQWDILLLECGFLAIFLAPFRWRLGRSELLRPPRLIIWLFRWVLFRLMFESGVVKLESGDGAWRHLTALNFHYETQPLPTWIGWYAHQLPEGFQKFCLVVMFGIELAVPFLIFTPRRPRFIAFVLLVFLQVCILLTGNYCFFNWLTIALCFLLLDDAQLSRLAPRKFRKKRLMGISEAEREAIESSPSTCSTIRVPESPEPRRKPDWPLWVTIPVAAMVVVVSLPQVARALRTNLPMPSMLEGLSDSIEPLHLVNGYGLFAVMTTSRHEIILEGSNDGTNWLAYQFKYKPGDVRRRPGFVAPHQPRLDWQMWFAALGTYRENPWFLSLCGHLLRGTPEVIGLLDGNPFPNAPPKFLRARVFDYHFTNSALKAKEGAWWRREYIGDYLPVTLSQSDLK